jgi:Protein of unknown function (DUF4125)
MKEKIISEIIDAEWKMFHAVPGIEGPAPCQQDPKTFRIMRFSQAMSWSNAALESYKDDLVHAEKEERNLMTEKYARMMESTSPGEYARVKHLIPDLAPETRDLIAEIVSISIGWEEELLGKYPHILKKGRPIHTADDTLTTTSFETYIKCELETYSTKTLALYHENILRQKSQKINGSEITLDYMVKQYGYSSPEAANEQMKPGGQRGTE